MKRLLKKYSTSAIIPNHGSELESNRREGRRFLLKNLKNHERSLLEKR